MALQAGVQVVWHLIWKSVTAGFPLLLHIIHKFHSRWLGQTSNPCGRIITIWPPPPSFQLLCLAGRRPIFKATIENAFSVIVIWQPCYLVDWLLQQHCANNISQACVQMCSTWRSWSFFMATTKPNSSARCFCTWATSSSAWRWWWNVIILISPLWFHIFWSQEDPLRSSGEPLMWPKGTQLEGKGSHLLKKVGFNEKLS